MACLCTVAWLQVAWAQDTETQDAAAHDDALVVGGEDGYVPFETLNAAGEPEGFHVDLMREAAQRMGRPVRFEIGPWPPLRSAIEDGTIDVLGMFASEDRARTVRFLDPHMIVYHRIYQPAGAWPLQGVRDFEGRTVVVQRDAYSHEHLQGLDLQGTELILVADEREGLRRLAAGDADAALLTEHRARLIVEEEALTSLTVSGAPVLPAAYAFAVPLGADALAAELNQALLALRADGTYDRLHRRWLSTDLNDGAAKDGPPGTAAARAWLPWAAAAVAVLLGLAGVRVGAAVAQARSSRRRLTYLKTHDGLTGLLHRHAFERQVHDLTRPSHDDTAASDAGARQHALAVLHVDRFRLVNETLGHAKGDRVLTEVAACLRACLRPRDVAARLGSDEFAVAFVHLRENEATDLCERIATEVRTRAFGRDDAPLRVTVSIGLLPFRSGATSVTELIRDADAACLAAKEVGGDRVHRWQPDDLHVAQRRGELRWVQDIPLALDEDRIEPFWQAIVPADATSSALPSIELLVRLRTPDGEPVAAGRFMPAAERYGLAERIDRRMLERALAWLDGDTAVRASVQRVHLNLSGRSVSDPRFLQWFEARLAASPRLLPLLCFEITETALIANLDTALQVLERLRKRGCRFALDDFGVGVSSMAYLKRLPVDLLKIDGSFVRDLSHDPHAASIIAQIHRLGRSIGLRTVAEFVETEEIRAHLAAIGVDEVQGYAVSRPEPLSELITWCERRVAARRSASVSAIPAT
ncbi:MAG: EAL domain-containing protein [Trueperaceae bacterium]